MVLLRTFSFCRAMMSPLSSKEQSENKCLLNGDNDFNGGLVPGRKHSSESSLLPLTGFWCRESTKLRGFSMVYLRSRMVCRPPPSVQQPFLEDFAWSSTSQSRTCSGLMTGAKTREERDKKCGCVTFSNKQEQMKGNDMTTL